MSREETSKTKREVMANIARLIPDATIEGRKLIKTKKNFIRVWASRDYEDDGKGVHNWFGFFHEDLNMDANNIMLFTTGNIKNFLMIPFEKFANEIKPYLRETTEGYFFLIRREHGKWFLPNEYIPKEMRGQVNNGIDLNKFVNNLAPIDLSYEEYLRLFDSKEHKSVNVNTANLTSMIKEIAEKDPNFLAKSTEEKLIIIRYYQLKNG